MSSSQPPLVVVGASLAGLRAVEAARRTGHTGPITLLGAEEHLPYDRPPLSKAFLDADGSTAPSSYRTREQLAELDVDLHLGSPATALDPAGHRVQVDGQWLDYAAAVIATGATARTLPGEQLAGVHTLRTLDDARQVRAALDAGAQTVVVGGGFIGSEVASAAARRQVDVTVVEAAPLPLVRAVGAEMAQACADLHHRYGTRLLCGSGVQRLVGTDRVEAVVLEDGTHLDADLVVVGIGAQPATGWLAGSGLTLDDGVVCDPTLRAADGVYAAGDVARWVNPLFGTSMRLEHWTNATEQAGTAARNALDPASATEHRAVPYFWSEWYGNKLQMVGVADGDEVHVVGGPDALAGDQWVALFRRGDQLTGALTLNLPGKTMKYRARIAAGGSWADALDFAGAR
ncbi:FAD-dependent oxidoreductase [Rhodococcus sp. X156]|uniref:NAD(P)/FAD-dependent oxidoreductase n=1 Tax=Rhodococcus sp. X156 TaxID=2499145 RepID=UPI000FDB6A0F|nr:FAD-dependent oxidoreductase [Rhodococcus sp. X156]